MNQTKSAKIDSEGRSFKFALGNSVEDLKISIENHLKFSLARSPEKATSRDWWAATANAVRDRIVDRMLRTIKTQHQKNVRRMYYLSLEYLMGRLLVNNLLNAGVLEETKAALEELGLDFEEILDEENDMGLGNGGLGRLAACFLDSLASLDLPAIGYGIHYEFGLFRQEIFNGYQVEHPDNWLRYDDPWEIIRPDHTQRVHLYGNVEMWFDSQGRRRPVWVNTRTILGVPYDVPIAGYDTNTVNFLRLWKSKATGEFDLQVFNEGGYVEAVREKSLSETVSKVLYPNDMTESGRELRLVQQYFFVSCSLRDIISRFHRSNENWDAFPEKVVVQLNDTHPAVAIAELMRIFLDEEEMEWERAWGIVTKVFAYTNHTLLPEALEKWTVELFEKVLPRHLQIIYEINHHHLQEVEKRWPGDAEKKAQLSLIEEGEPKMVRMAHLAVVGSFSVNGVAALHTELLKKDLFSDFDEMFPKRFNNKTNGITPRRWLRACNPRLSELITEKIGSGWECDLARLQDLEEFADDREFQERFMAIKRANKEDLGDLIFHTIGIDTNVDAIFDVQIKRLHEYKRQHLNLLYILGHYRRLLANPDLEVAPRVFIFGAKAAPGYKLAKLIIKAIDSAAQIINRD
ncbi:MAG TPA: glycogen/starch/alpha-glucan family phosphorylase, partial [Opitutales bacterium]|nr:glycogen/starch/alpha-glucan family phosphorylase [Opitutales bacterium]